MENLTFKVGPKRRDKAPRVTLGGEVTIYTAAELKERLLSVLHSERGVEIDTGGVTDIDTAGLQLLLSAKRHCDEAGQPFLLVKPSEALTCGLRLLNLDAAFA